MIYPHLLLALVLTVAVSVSAASAALFHMQAAENFTEYYEIRIIELMALKHFIEQPGTAAYSFSTNKGLTTVTVSEMSPEQQRIRVTTALPERLFSASFYYDKERGLVTARLEHQ